MRKLPTWVEVDLDRLARNLDRIRARVGKDVKVLLTVKADAYGHGAVQVAQAARGHADMLGVATLDEAIELREAGVERGILILSPILETQVPAVAGGAFAVTISELAFAVKLSEFGVAHGVSVDVHVEVDTGMGRTGVAYEDARDEIARIAELPGLRLSGAYTHFPVSDTDPDFTRRQITLFEELLADLRGAGVDIPLAHAANSAAVAGLPESHMGMVRPGLLAYGLHPAGDAAVLGVEPVMSWKSRVVRVRRVSAGKRISYGRDFVTKRASLIGVIPVGYGHGFPYRAGGGGAVLVGGRRVPIVGRVTMDMTMVDLTDLPQAPAPGDEVVLVGAQGDERITFHDLAQWAGSICYEVMCGISKRVPRTYFREGRVETYKSLLGILPNHVAV
jgi:alanine racemase